MSFKRNGHDFKSITFIFPLVLFIASSVLGLTSSAANNFGALFQNLALAQPEDTQKNYYLMRSRYFLDIAKKANLNNRYAWRNLGYVYLYLSDQDSAIAAWHNYADMPTELLGKAHIASNKDDIESALYWFDLMTSLSPEWGEGWYSLGLFYDSQQELDLAMAAFLESTKHSEPGTCVLSSSYYRLGKLFQRRAKNNDFNTSIHMLEAALKDNSFCDVKLKAEVFYSLGELYILKGYANADVISKFSTAVRLNPNHHWARLKLSYAVFREDGNWEEAVKDIQIVIAAWEKSNSPNLKWGYRFLGDVYFQSGLNSEAFLAYKQALSLDKTDEYVLEKIESLNSEGGS